MGTCPQCGTNSRTEPDAFTLTEVFVAKPIGTFSVAGAQMKAVAIMRLKLQCRCGWTAYGYMDDGDLIVEWTETQT